MDIKTTYKTRAGINSRIINKVDIDCVDCAGEIYG